jgi:hypothetical protein
VQDFPKVQRNFAVNRRFIADYAVHLIPAMPDVTDEVIDRL